MGTTANHSRSERKRSREKQRRTDVNKQFNELTDVIKRLESEEQQIQQELATKEQEQELQRQLELEDVQNNGGESRNSHKRFRLTALQSSSSSTHTGSLASSVVAGMCVLPPFSPTN